MAAIDFGDGPNTETGDTVAQALAKLQARLDAYQGSAPAPTPTPTPAPVFTTPPSISPTGGSSGSTVFTAANGVASNSTGFTRRWLLAGTSIGTGSTVTPQSAGQLILEVTATGPGGSTTATTSAVTVSAPTPTPGPTPTPAPTIAAVHQEGDSITYDNGVIYKNFAHWWAEVNPSITVTNTAVVSSGIGSIGDAPGTNSLHGRFNQVVASAPDLLTGLIGPNDMAVSPSAAAYRDKLWTYIDRVEADPSISPIIGWGGILPMSETLGNWQSAATVNARRVAFNADLRAEVGGRIDFYIPFGDAMDVAYADNPMNFYDGLHPDNNGKRFMRRIYAAVMDPIVAKASGDTPAQFGVPDQNNAAPSAWVEQSFIVTGMGMGRTQTFTVTGGQIARGRMGNPAFGASVVAMNGDLIRWRVQAAAAADTPASSTLTAGPTSSTVTVRSARAAGNVTFASSADVRTVQRSPGNEPYNFAAVQFPEGRPIVVLDMLFFLVSGVQVNGIALQQVSPVDNNDDAHAIMWVAPAGTNLAAGTYDVVVTTVYNGDCVLFPAAVQGSSTATGSLAVGRIRYANQITGDHSSALLPVASGAICVSFAATPGDATFTFDATVERTYPGTIDVTDGNGRVMTNRWIVSRASREPTFSNTSLTYAGLVSVVFE